MLAYLSLGSNVGDRLRNLAEAVRRLDAAGSSVVAVSAVYETEPQGKRDQPWFLNCALEVQTDLPARALLAHALAVETAMGRERGVRWGPRNIDVDLLLYGDRQVDEPDLVLPHPRLHERAFALVPLADLAPHVHIGQAGPVADLAAARRHEPGQSLRRWGTLPHPEGAAATSPPRGPGGGAARPEGADRRALVLARLRAASGQPLSGTALSRELGISRAAVWKHVRALRADGHAIEGAAGSGYRLPRAGDADALAEADLVSLDRRRVGRIVHLLPSVDSTNTRAKQLGLEGAPDGSVVVAAEQTAGRGRNGRSFLSPLGGVYLSAVLRPRLPPPQAVRLTLMAALAACEALETAADLAPVIKWPNDVLLPAGKVCGILLEMVAAEDCVDFVVLGCGVNVTRVPPVAGACSLWSAGARVSREAVARAFIDALDACYSTFQAGDWPGLLDRWRSRCVTLGQRVAVTGLDDRRLEGRAVDVTEDGALVIESEDGWHTVLAGDVQHLRGML